MLSKLLGLFLRHALNPVVLLSVHLSPVLATEPCPEGQVDQCSHSNKTHRDGMALDEAGPFVCFVQL